MIKWDKYFSNIYVVSRCLNFDKRESIEREFKRIGLNNYNWFYNCDDELIDYERLINYHRSKAAVRCTHAHYRLIKTLYELNYDNVLIIEDDIHFLQDISKIKKQLDIFNKQKHLCNGYFFSYVIYGISIFLADFYYLDRKLMKYLLYCFEHYPCANDNYIFTNYIYPNDVTGITMQFGSTTSNDSITAKISSEDNLLPLQIMLAPQRISIQPDKINFYTAENSEHVTNKIENFNEYNV